MYGYAEVSDVLQAIGGTTTADEQMIARLIDRATTKMDAYFQKSGVCVDHIEPLQLMECCCEMVEPFLRVAVGDDYGDELNYEAATPRVMSVPYEWQRIFGAYPRGRQRVVGLAL